MYTNILNNNLICSCKAGRKWNELELNKNKDNYWHICPINVHFKNMSLFSWRHVGDPISQDPNFRKICKNGNFLTQKGSFWKCVQSFSLCVVKMSETIFMRLQYDSDSISCLEMAIFGPQNVVLDILHEMPTSLEGFHFIYCTTMSIFAPQN